MLAAEFIAGALLIYSLCGLVVGLPFVLYGIVRIDHAAKDTSLAFRLLVLPGAAALWPLMAAKWVRSRCGGSFS
jgi:hypothetical protein